MQKDNKFLSERILFGGLFGLGYFILVLAPLTAALILEDDEMVKESLATVRDALLVLGPVIGMIAQSIWKADRVERQNADTLNTLANHTAAGGVSASGAPVSPGPTPEMVDPATAEEQRAAFTEKWVNEPKPNGEV